MAPPGMPTMPALDPMMEAEMQYRHDLLTRMFNNCYERCAVVNRPGQAESKITVGEHACIDRCTSKYMQVVEQVGQLLGMRRGEE
mmetsp:Transcript_14407/g.42001  ORF Transcript_14407/g.42001 Transcript_14407/m.42001 type:complete len:85 (+) Transcript_14407:140-394(+)